MEKVIITCALTGNFNKKSQNPNIPTAPEEIVRSALESREAGAAMVHIHFRDEEDKPSFRRDIIEKIVYQLRERSDLILCLTTGSSVHSEEERMTPLEFQPEFASFDAGSLNINDRVFVNSPQFLEKLARRMLEKGVRPEIEIFDRGQIENTMELVKRGLIKPPLHFQLVLGIKGGAPADARTLVYLVESLPPGATWSAIGIGVRQLPINLMALAMGGHVRTGLEDNIYYHRGELAKSNAQLVARIVRIAEEFGREVATPDEAREILGLKPRVI